MSLQVLIGITNAVGSTPTVALEFLQLIEHYETAL